MIPGYRTTEFAATLAAIVGAWALSIADAIPAQYAAYMTVLSAVAYAASRAIFKKDSDLKRGWRTSEFWVAVASVLATVIAAVPSALTAKVAGILSVTVVAAYAIVRALSKPNYERAYVAEEMHVAAQMVVGEYDDETVAE